MARGAPLPEIAAQLGLGIRLQPDYAIWEVHAGLPPLFPPASGTDIPVMRLGCHPVSLDQDSEPVEMDIGDLAPEYSDISDAEEPIID